MKTLVFVTSFPSPHVLPLIEALQQHYDVVGCIQMMQMSEERKKLGYNIASSVKVYLYSECPDKCKKIIIESDVLIMACGNFEVLDERIAIGKEIYVMHERLFKKGLLKLLDPRLWKYFKICQSARNKNIYLLAVGTKSAQDFACIGFPKNKIYKFAYFPKIELFEPVVYKRETVEILWVGRMVGVKRPIMALRLIRQLPSGFNLTMVGDGKLMKRVRKYIADHHLSVCLMGQITNDEVRQLMKEKDILLSTSNRGEGWGAVVNEGMNLGCAIVCSDSIGCYGTLVDDENACIYRTNSIRSLVNAIKQVSSNLKYYQNKSIEKIQDEMNPGEAARRFSALQHNLSQGKSGIVFDKGVCSKYK